MPTPRTLLAATAGLALAGLLPMQEASAQVARYCGNTVNAVAFYTNITPSGPGSNAVHFVQLQNMGPPRYIRIAFFSSEPGLTRGGGNYAVHPGVAPASTGDIAMGNQQFITVQLGTQRLNNPAGTGAIPATDPQTGLPHFTMVTCTP
jgi:hypothetical protein